MRVAFLGLGIMGSRMAANVSRAGFELTVWNRTRSRAEEFAQRVAGVNVAATPAQAAADAELVVTMVVDGDQVEHVLLGPDGAATLQEAEPLFVDCSTIGRTATVRIAEELGRRGLRIVDAPVTGSAPRAEDGTLTIMAGGSEEDFERARPVLETMGKLVIHAGPVGHGQLVKLINNAVAATNTAVVGQALLVGARAGVDLDALTAVMGAGSGGSVMLELKAEPMRTHDYTTLFKIGRLGREETVPFFKLDHMLKDVRLCLEEAERLGVPFPAAEAVERVLASAAAMGHGEDDFAALIDALEREAGVKLDG